MTVRETGEIPLDEHASRDFELKQPSVIGPWLTFGLGLSVLVLAGSLLYMNLTRSALTRPTPTVERPLRPEGDTAVPANRSKRAAQRASERRQPALTTVPQGRAPNALLGGQGPALPPDHSPRGAATPPGPGR